MYFHLINSINCNSECRYCYKKSMDDAEDAIFSKSIDLLNRKFKFEMVPENVSYSVEDLKEFVEKSREKTTLTFYGGEPLLNITFIREVMDKIQTRYMLQTNGKLLYRLPKEYANRFEVILISIDGGKEITDFNRGDGAYEQVIRNIQILKKNGFNGELIARMVVDENSPRLLENIKHLLTLFDAVHWQLDAGFYAGDYKKRNFNEFSKKYNQEVRELADFWVENMKNGKVLRIYPFLGIFESLFYGKKEKLRCGSGYANYTITTNGKISVCPIMHDASSFYVGSIFKSNPDRLKKIHVGGFCRECDILDVCGGRCLYSNRAELWPREGQDLICKTVRNLIDSIEEKLPQIKDLIEKGIIKESDFFYEKYNGAEIIP